MQSKVNQWVKTLFSELGDLIVQYSVYSVHCNVSSKMILLSSTFKKYTELIQRTIQSSSFTFIIRHIGLMGQTVGYFKQINKVSSRTLWKNIFREECHKKPSMLLKLTKIQQLCKWYWESVFLIIRLLLPDMAWTLFGAENTAVSMHHCPARRRLPTLSFWWENIWCGKNSLNN